MNRIISLRWAGLGLAVGVHFLLATSPCRADLVPIGFTESPVILSFNGSLTYDVATGNFRSQTVPLTYTSDQVPFGLFSPTSVTTVDLFVDQSGSFVASGGGVQINGSLDLNEDGINDVSGLLLFGSITAFGAEPAGPPSRAFNALWQIDGGALTQLIPLSGGGSVDGGFPLGGLGLVFLEAENVSSGTLGNFTTSFSSSSVKDIVGPAVPAPPSLILGLVGGTVAGGFGLVKRRTGRPRSPG